MRISTPRLFALGTGESRSPSKVSIVIVSFNDEPLLTRLFSSLKKQTYRELEVILVDNANNPSIRRLAVLERVRYVPSRNVGYAGGNNLGVRCASGQFVMVLNPDTWLECDAIERLVSFFGAVGPLCMVVSPKIMIRNSRLINSVGMKRYRKWANLYTNIGYLETDKGQYDRPAKVEAFDGPAFMFRRELLKETYLFDPLFFYGAETTDLAERVRKLAFEIWACPQAVVHHEIHGSYREKPFVVRPRMLRNNLAHTLTNHGIGRLAVTLVAVLISCLAYVRKRQLFTAKQCLGGIALFILNVGILVKSARILAGLQARGG